MAAQDDPMVIQVLDNLGSMMSSSAAKAHAPSLKRFFRWCDERPVHPLLASGDDLRAFTGELEGDLKPTTIAHYQGGLSAFYRSALDVGVIQRSPMDGFQRISKAAHAPVTLVPLPTVRALREGAARSSAWDAVAVDLMVLNGLEVAEIKDANIEDLRSDGNTYWLTVRGRSGQARDIPLAPPIAAPLQEILGSRRRGPLLLRSGVRPDRTTLQRAVSRAARKAGIEVHIAPSELRSTFISVALSSGVPLNAIRDAIGIKDVRGLDRFVALRGAASDVPARVAEAVLADAEAGLLVQARRLLNDDVPVHVAAPIVLIGAALEEHLRTIVIRERLPFTGEGSITAYAGALRTARHLTKQDMKGISWWADLRNDAAHGDIARLTRDHAEAMLLGVSELVERVL